MDWSYPQRGLRSAGWALLALVFGSAASAQPGAFITLPKDLPAEEARRIEEAAPTKAAAAPRKPRKLLVFNYSRGWVHSAIPYGARALEILGAKTGGFEVVHSMDMDVFTPARLADFDAICLNNSSALDWSTAAQQAILNFVGEGKGMVGIHGATAGIDKWSDGAALFGGSFDGHPWTANGTWAVKLDDPSHPINLAFQGKGFTIQDELYRMKFVQPARESVRVLASIDMADEATRNAKDVRPGETDYPLSWVRRFGQGRVFYTSFGHRHESYWNPAILQHVLAGVQFALGDLAVDTTPGPAVGAIPPASASGPTGAEVASPAATTGIPPAAVTKPGPEYKTLFNGHDLSGWRGSPSIWSVKDGVITGRTTTDIRISENNFLVWTGGDVQDFELRCTFRLESGNSGIYFRSLERKAMEPEPLAGCQADISSDGKWTGVVMEYTRRNILAKRGQRARVTPDGKNEVLEMLGDPSTLLEAVKPGEWNQYVVTAKAGHIVLTINDVVMCDLQDDDPRRIVQGKLALQVHVGPPMLVQFKDIFLRELK